MSDFDREVCRRLPLADATWHLLHFTLADDFLDQVFDQHRGRSYEDLLTFPHFVHLLTDALFDHTDASACQTFRRADEAGQLPVCLEAVYGKLRRVPLPLSQALLRHATERLQQVFPGDAHAHHDVPPGLHRFDVYAFDGKKLKHVAKKLKALRSLKGQILGGKLLVVQQLDTGLAVAFQAAADGEAADNPLVAGALAQVPRQGERPRLWLADRLFCDLVQLPVLARDGDHFLVRYQAKVKFHADPSRPARHGGDAQGVAYTEDWGWLGTGKRRVEVRRIVLHRTDAEPLVVVTSLLDADSAPAAELLEAYRRRWGIECLFQQVTEVFDLRHLIGTTPQATVMQAALCLLLANVLSVVRGYVAAGQQQAAATLSGEILWQDVVRQLISWEAVLGVGPTLACLGDQPLSAATLRHYLQDRLGSVWSERWRKTPPPKKPRRQQRPGEKSDKQYLKGGHSSVFRILRGLHEIREQPAEAP